MMAVAKGLGGVFLKTRVRLLPPACVVRYPTTAGSLLFCETGSFGKVSLAPCFTHHSLLVTRHLGCGRRPPYGDLDWRFNFSSHVLLPDLETYVVAPDFSYRRPLDSLPCPDDLSVNHCKPAPGIAGPHQSIKFKLRLSRRLQGASYCPDRRRSILRLLPRFHRA